MSQSENPSSGSSVTLPSNTASTPDQSNGSPRSNKNFKLMVAGSAFVIMSAIITRRGVYRRQQWAKPTFFRQNNQHPEQKIDGSLEALEALSVATVNVFSWSLLFSGGMLWAFDITNLEELRSKLRVRLGITKDEQQGSQNVVGEWIEAAKPWKLGSKQKSTTTEGSAKDETSGSSASK